MPQIAFLSEVAGAPGSFRRYAFILILSAFVPMLAVAAFVIGIDPYYVFGTPSVPGINAVRPFYESHVIIAKPYQVWRLRPEAVALGSSRVEVGIDPHHPGWGARNVFNFAMPSSTIYEEMLALTHAQTVGGPLRQAVLGLDFFGFNIFFPRIQEQTESRFAGDGVAEFARFLDEELKLRKKSAPISPSKSGNRSTPIFDERLYLALNPDVAGELASGAFKSAFEHYDASVAPRAEKEG